MQTSEQTCEQELLRWCDSVAAAVEAGSVALEDLRPGIVTGEELVLAERLRSTIGALQSQSLALGELVGRPFPAAIAGTPHLTARELTVLAMLQRGLTAAGIASRLHISERTVHKHLERLYRKLDVRDRLSAIRSARQRGLLS